MFNYIPEIGNSETVLEHKAIVITHLKINVLAIDNFIQLKYAYKKEKLKRPYTYENIKSFVQILIK